MELVEVQPIEFQSKTTRRFMSYQKIKTDLITREVLLRIYQLMKLKPGIEVKILETPKYYIVQYGDKCPILINKETGRLYVIEGLGYPKEVMEHQASILLRILHRHGLVDGLTCKRIHVGAMVENTKTKNRNIENIYISQNKISRQVK